MKVVLGVLVRHVTLTAILPKGLPAFHLDLRTVYTDPEALQSVTMAAIGCTNLVCLGMQNGSRVPSWNVPKVGREPAAQLLMENLHRLPALQLLFLRIPHPKSYGIELRNLLAHKSLRHLILNESDTTIRLGATCLSSLILNVPQTIESIDISKVR